MSAVVLLKQDKVKIFYVGKRSYKQFHTEYFNTYLHCVSYIVPKHRVHDNDLPLNSV